MTLHAAHTIRPRPVVPEIQWWAGPDGELHGFAEGIRCLCRERRWTAALSQRGIRRAASCMTVLRALLAGAQPATEAEARFAHGDR